MVMDINKQKCFYKPLSKVSKFHIDKMVNRSFF